MCKHWIKSCEVEIAASEIRDSNFSVSKNICFIHSLKKKGRKKDVSFKTLQFYLDSKENTEKKCKD